MTALFCDLVGFTSRSEQMDIEDVRSTLSPYHELLRGELERHGGTVEKFIGDAVMALFGAPLAREDDAERAVQAALSILDAVAGLRESQDFLDLHVRIGVNTGEALVKLDANPTLGEGMVFGDPVNVAARLQSAAPVDGVIVGEDTYQLTRRRIAYESLEPITVKGKREPIKAWLVVRAEIGGEEQVRLVGRADELGVLVGALPRPGQTRARLVAVIGDAGVGKSRLLAAVRERGSGRRGLTWHDAVVRDVPSSPYGPFAALVRSLIGATALDSSETAWSKLRQATRTFHPDPQTRAWVEDEAAILLGLADAPSAGDRRVEAFAAWIRLIAGAAASRPRVLVLDDLHWASDFFLDFVGELVGRVEGPVLFLLALRPDARERVEQRLTPHRTIDLAPLAVRDAEGLFRRFLRRAEPDGVVTNVTRRSGGNPLFLREYARFLESRTPVHDRASVETTPPIPHSVRAMIAARLDALDPDEKELGQVASVLARPITPVGVAVCAQQETSRAERALVRLSEHGVLDHDAALPAALGTAYRFQHDLFREVAYETLPRRRRAELHVGAGDWLVGQAGFEERLELTAHHYGTAITLLRATRQPVGEVAGKAKSAYRAAGDAAFSLNAFASAVHNYEAALNLAREAASADEAQLLLALGEARDHCQDGLPEELPTAAERLRASGDREHAARAEMLIGFWLGNHGRMAEGLPHSTLARELLAGLPPSRVGAEIAISLGERAVLAGAVEDGEALCREALGAAISLGLSEVEGQANLALAVSRIMRGDVDVRAELDRVISAVAENHSPRAAVTTMNAADVLRWLGDLPGSFRAQTDGERRAAELETVFLRRLTAAERVRRSWYQGRWDDALAEADRMILEIEAGNAFHLEVSLRLVRAHIRAAKDHDDDVGRDLAEAVDAARRSGDPEALIPALAAQARTAALGGDVRSGMECLAEIADALDGGPRFLWGPALGDIAAAALVCGQEPVLRTLVARPPNTAWTRAALAMLNRDLDEAVRRYRAIGSVPDERVAQLIREGRPASGSR